ncbi:MAG: thioredoxin family protein [Ignavibacteriales bacterium]|nr:thioredoxin family protein [Ignavibacteriales bacterium]
MIAVYIILGIIGLFVLLQISQVLLARKAKGTKLTGLQGPLKALEKSGSKGMVYFYSPACHACKTITPVIKQMATEHKNIFAVDISKDRSALQVFGIKATPTTMVVENGVISQVLLGARSKDVLQKLVNW